MSTASASGFSPVDFAVQSYTEITGAFLFVSVEFLLFWRCHSGLPLKVAAASATKTQGDAEHGKKSHAPDKDEAAKSWLNRRAQRHSGNL